MPTELIPFGLILLVISSLMVVKDKLKDKISHKEAEDKFQEIKLCKEIHKSVNEKLNCLPEMKKSLTQIEIKIDTLLKNNN